MINEDETHLDEGADVLQVMRVNVFGSSNDLVGIVVDSNYTRAGSRRRKHHTKKKKKKKKSTRTRTQM